MTKYVGMDVHKASTSVTHQNDDGRVVSQMVIETRPRELIAAVSGYDERVEVAFEEAQWAAWLYELLRPHVDRVAVHRAGGHRNKTDAIDARRLAKLLRLDELDGVYHGPEVDTQLKILMKSYHRAKKNVIAEKNRIKDEFISQQIDCPGTEVYQAEHRDKWLEKLEGEGAKLRATQAHQRLQLAVIQKDEAKNAMERAAKKREGWSSVSSLPGFGVVRTSTVLAIIGTPWRFPTKQKLWSYVGLGVDLDESSQYERQPDGEFRRKEVQRTRGLTNDYNRRLKDAFKGAAETAIREYEEVDQDYRARCRRKDESLARLDIARKLVSQCWTIWKRKEEYDADKACWDQL